MKEGRTFTQEAKAMEFVIQSLYREREYLLESIEKNKYEKDRVRLQMVNHFIEIYEGY